MQEITLGELYADPYPERELAPPPLSLGEPGTIEFTAERALRGRALNRFALSLRSPAKRAEFLAGELAFMLNAGLTAPEIRLVQDRDWTGLLLAGGHLQAILKLAATVGQDLWDIGAHNAGCGRATLMRACPRVVSALPGKTPDGVRNRRDRHLAYPLDGRRVRPGHDGSRRVQPALETLVRRDQAGGTEAAELALWFAMRAALSEQAVPVYTVQTFPAITGCGALVMTEPGVLAEGADV